MIIGTVQANKHFKNQERYAKTSSKVIREKYTECMSKKSSNYEKCQSKTHKHRRVKAVKTSSKKSRCDKQRSSPVEKTK